MGVYLYVCFVCEVCVVDFVGCWVEVFVGVFGVDVVFDGVVV